MMNNRLKAIVHTPFNPFFKGNGAHVRARQFIDFFATEFDTTVIYTNADSEVLFDKKKLTGLAKANNFEIYPLNTSFKFSKLKGISTSADIYPFDVSEEIAKVCMQINPDICLVNYVFLTHTFSFCDQDCKTIIDTHDKLSRKHVFEEAGLDVSFFCCTEEHEQELCKTADSIISITNTEAEYFLQTL